MATVQEKAMCVLWFHERKSVITVRRRFRAEYKRDPPLGQSIKRWYKQFKETGSVQKMKGSGRPPVGDDVVDAVRGAFTRSPRKSTRRASLELGIPRSTVMKVLHKRLRLRAYKIQLLHALKPNDKPRRADFAAMILDGMETDNTFLENIVFSDEATFHVSGRVNRHNCRIWGSENPHDVREHERDSPKVNVWCGLGIHGVIGPFFFTEPTVTGNTYLDMLVCYAIPQLEHMKPHVYFQLDGAPPHWATSVRDCLDANFPGHWIGRDGPLQWPPRSPDLTPLDFCLWGYVKDRVYATRVGNIMELKQRITSVIQTVTPEMLQNVWREVEYRLDVVRATKGAHVEIV